MKTDDLITLLASGAGPVANDVASRRFTLSLALSVPLSLLLMQSLLGLLPYLGEAITWPQFWMKVAFAGSIAGAGFAAVYRLASPGRRVGYVSLGILAPIAVIWIITAVVLLNAGAAERMALLLGQTWAVCPFLITMLSAPIFIGTLWAVRGLAPTNLAKAGAACGLFSGAMGALVYSLHCPELEAPFVGSWYLLGILIPTCLGYIIGRRTLRW